MFESKIVPIEVPCPLRLDAFHGYVLNIDFNRHILADQIETWSRPLICSLAQKYIMLTSSLLNSCFKRKDLHKNVYEYSNLNIIQSIIKRIFKYNDKKDAKKFKGQFQKV